LPIVISCSAVERPQEHGKRLKGFSATWMPFLCCINRLRVVRRGRRVRFVVESTESIAGTSWATVDVRPVQITQLMVADLPIGETGMRFFRVRN
jgi:hypothetical protein